MYGASPALDPIEQARQLLQQQAQQLRDTLSELESKRSDIMARLAQAESGLRGLDAKADPSSISVHPNQFRGKRLADALEEYLEAQKGEVSINELVSVLAQGHADLGANPQRTISIAVSTNPKRLYKEGRMVGLVKKKA